MDINQMRDTAHQTAVEKGWWTPVEQEVSTPGASSVKAWVPRSFGEQLMLVVTEAAEAMEDWRVGRPIDKMLYEYRAQPGRPVLHADGKSYVYKRLGHAFDMDVDPTTSDNWELLTPENGAQYGFEVKPIGIPSELADIIIRVGDIAGYYGIDLEAAVVEKMTYNETRGYRHGGKLA